jgi:hypothetical protein
MMIPVPTPESSQGSSGWDTWAGLDSSCRTKFLDHGSPAPIWLKARAQTIGFRHGDLVRTHWRKVRRAMVEVDMAASEAGFMKFTVG